MNQSPSADTPALNGNSDLADTFFKLICDRATAIGVSTVEVTVQVIYHLSIELLLSDVPLGMLEQVADRAAIDVEFRLDEIVGGSA